MAKGIISGVKADLYLNLDGTLDKISLQGGSEEEKTVLRALILGQFSVMERTHYKVGHDSSRSDGGFLCLKIEKVNV